MARFALAILFVIYRAGVRRPIKTYACEDLVFTPLQTLSASPERGHITHRLTPAGPRIYTPADFVCVP